MKRAEDQHGGADRSRRLELEQQAALLALDALSPEERAAFEEVLDEDRASEALTEDLRRVAAELALLADPVAPPPELSGRVLAAGPGGTGSASTPAGPAGVEAIFAELAARAVDGYDLRSDAGDWVPTGLPGVTVRYLAFEPEAGRRTYQLRCQPGSVIPPHRHRGREELFVVEGDLRCDGEVYRPGDYTFRPENTGDPVATSETGCLLLVVAHGVDFSAP